MQDDSAAEGERTAEQAFLFTRVGSLALSLSLSGGSRSARNGGVPSSPTQEALVELVPGNHPRRANCSSLGNVEILPIPMLVAFRLPCRHRCNCRAAPRRLVAWIREEGKMKIFMHARTVRPPTSAAAALGPSFALFVNTWLANADRKKEDQTRTSSTPPEGRKEGRRPNHGTSSLARVHVE